jgi:hypothetical protein
MATSSGVGFLHGLHSTEYLRYTCPARFMPLMPLLNQEKLILH